MKYARTVLVTLAAVFFLFGICGQAPNVPDKPKGPSQAAVAVVYACTTQTTDPKGLDVAYQFDWGDGNQSTWSSFMAGGTAFPDTHTYSQPGPYDVKARAKNSKKASGWSQPLAVTVNPAEGNVRWSFAFTDPEDPEDSADFTPNTFGIDYTRDACYVGCEYGAVIARKLSSALRWQFLNPDADEFSGGVTVGDDGTAYFGCANDSFYAVNSDGTRKWVICTNDEVTATAAIAANGTVYIQTTGDSLLAIGTDHNRVWSCLTDGGLASPVIGKDGTVYAASQEGSLYAIDPSNGGKKWTYLLASGVEIDASPAIDDSLKVIYVADADGRFASVDLTDGTENWEVNLGELYSSPVIGVDHTIYIGAGGKLLALSHTNGATVWTFNQPMTDGAVSTPAVSNAGTIYALVTIGKKKNDFFTDPDSLFAVNSDGTRRWACALGEGFSAEVTSAPKLDDDGNIYITSGLVAWCVRGNGGPASSPWPMFQADGRNTGRAR
jgi:outer membrane protein assembly factor BamB